jgi:ApeA N-terminal domain 1
MRIKEEFKKSGYFWLPSAPERKIPGTLYISDGGNIELEVIELFDLNLHRMYDDDDNLERIVGVIEEDGCVTLDNCFYKQKNRSFGGVSKKSLLYVNKAFVGVAYDEKENISFNDFVFSVEGIDEWVGISGIQVDRKYETELTTATINYLPPEDIALNLNNGMQLLITFSWMIPGYPCTREAKISQKTYFKLVSTDPRSLDEFISIVHRITTFLCFAIDQTVCLDDITAMSNDILINAGNDNSISAPIKIYYQSIPYSKHDLKIDLHRMLFRYGQVKEDATKIINNWIDAYDRIDPALSLYFSTKVGAQKYLDGKFLALVQGLETYHRRTSTDKLMDEEKFKELVEGIVSNCPDENKEWLEGRLRHGNEINLRKRIESIVKPFKGIIGNAKERSKLITRIVDTRNYLTHYDESSKLKAADGQDLLSLCYKMEAVFQLHFLQVLGFTPEEIKSLLSNSYPLQEKLNLKL